MLLCAAPFPVSSRLLSRRHTMTIPRLVPCLMLLLAACVAPAHAAGREQLGVDEQGNTVFLETGNMTRKGYVVYAWQLVNRKAPDEQGALSVRSQVEFDCRNHLMRFMWTTLHTEADEGGKVISTGAVPRPSWEPAAPGSLADAQVDFACRHVMR